jgi:predicted SnoaL-like aldol condensation-catalyzing enzyme
MRFAALPNQRRVEHAVKEMPRWQRSFMANRHGKKEVRRVHIFRFDGDRIAEPWDIGQPVPAESVNTNGMF